MTTLTLGPEDTYAHRAARAVADDIAVRTAVPSIVEAVADGDVDRGVIPIENSIEGSVTESLDAIADAKVAVVRELVTPIRHALIAHDDTFTHVVSSPHALAQCRSYLEEAYPDATTEAVATTAAGVERARENPDAAAIAHPATVSDPVQVLADDIGEQADHRTRFFELAAPEERSTAGGKTTLIVAPRTDYPGLLVELLEPFAAQAINLSRLESRPTGERLGDYLFHIDLEAGLYEPRTRTAIETVEDVAADGWVRTLGSYDTEHVV